MSKLVFKLAHNASMIGLLCFAVLTLSLMLNYFINSNTIASVVIYYLGLIASVLIVSCANACVTLSLTLLKLINGVVQGSGIGPLLSVPFVNEPVEDLKSYGVSVKLFADDLKIYLKNSTRYRHNT